MEKVKVLVYSGKGDLAKHIGQRLFAQDYEVYLVGHAHFEGVFREITQVSFESSKDLLSYHEFDFGIICPQVDSHNLDKEQKKNLVSFYDDIIEDIYENFYTQRDGELIIINSYNDKSIFSLKIAESLIYEWKKRFAIIDARLRHHRFFYDNTEDSQILARDIENLFLSKGSKIKIFTLLKSVFSSILLNIKKLISY